MTIIAFNGVAPDIAADAFVASGARIIGHVTIGARASIWYNCVVRGDVGAITIGARTNIQDGSVVHVTGGKFNTVIGEDCLIGHLAMIHGCTLEDHSFVGLGAIVMDGCVIEADAMLAAGALLTPGKRIPAGQLWAGRPAVYLRDLKPDDIARNRAGAAGYVELAQRHKREFA
ncbi:gamma carbonic anhydrase family protein [Polymorphobacter arshaanensis]|uniref:Gamma carbonic anhydrase family protein n=1 Tax=Glacieibacterium arshaanense TaxID=2511025 RepID=A0A4Y9EQM8_9SPHN|nr:gamma carbonic anhydrase family protein [Polymorphobacter arshaanensis]TFU05650.1 gamma carbonic anhydrase family protein [Polymorphobacter arshaanensis]